MAEELIERVARALHAEMLKIEKEYGGDGSSFEGLSKEQRNLLDRLARAAIQSSQAVGERWQPIETAPKDGTDVLIWGPGHFVMIGRFTGLGSYSGPEWRSAWYGTPIAAEPSHWMPLPEPLGAHERARAIVENYREMHGTQTPSGEK